MELKSVKNSKLSKQALIDKINQLEQTVEGLSVTLHSIAEGVITTDCFGKITSMNEFAENLTGWKLKNAIGIEVEKVLDIYGVENKAKLNSPVQKVLKTGEKTSLESHSVLRSKYSNISNVILSAAPIKNHNNEIIGTVVVFSDTTDKFQIEKKIHESEKKYKSLVEEMHYGLALHEIIQDDKGKVVDYVFLDINNSYERQTGLKKQDVIGKRVLEVLPDLENYWIEKFGHVAITGQSIHYENYVSELDKHFEVIAYRPRKNQFAVIANDITNRKLSDDMLISSERKIKSILNTAPVGIGLIKDNKVIEANEYLSLILKYPTNEIIGFNFEDFFVSKEFFYQVWPGQISQMIDNDIPSLETQWIRKDGKIITVLLSSSHIIINDNYYGTTFTVLDISERKEHENKLRKSELKYRELIDFAVGGILIGSHEGYIIDANNLACKLLNKSYGQIVGKHISDKLFTIESLKESPLRFDLLNQGETVVNQRDVMVSDHKIITVETHTKQMPDKTYQMILHDITERKNAETELINSEAKFLTAFKENPIPSLLTSYYDGVIIDINDECEEISGWKRDEIIGKKTTSIYMWMNQSDRNIIFEELDKYGKIKNKKINIFNKNKQTVNVLFSSVPIEIQNQKCILTSAVNITPISKIQKELEDSEKKYGFLVENINDLVISIDANCNFLFVSELFLKIFGKKQHEVIGTSFLNFTQSDDVDIVKQAIEELKEEPYKSYFEINLATKKGLKFYAWSNKAILNENNELETITCIGRDITERKEMENKLMKAKELAEESSRLKTSFLSNMSHEIRTPMNAIMGFAELLKNPAIEFQKRNEFIDYMLASSKQLLSIIDDIIEISRIDSGMMKINKTPFYLNSFFSNIQITSNLLLVEKENLKIISDDYVINNNFLFYSDEVKLKQIFTNLITNSIKYTTKGYIEYGYHFKTENEITFYVKDTGIGIDSKYHEVVFDRFKQITNEFSWKQSGSGLGLAISKAYVEILGGKIWLESEPGNGSIFYFTIPIEKNVHKDFVEIIEKSSCNINLNGGAILIVEDNEMNQEYLSNLFSENNIEYLQAKNGKEAIEICKTHDKIRVVLMDLKMPEMDGFDASVEILKISPQLPIIAQTAYTSPEDITKATKIGCKAFISKPIRKKDLFKVISDVLS